MNEIQLPPIRLIPYSVNSADYNMAADELLFNFPFPILRFYGWKQRTLSFGKSNPMLDELDIEYCKKMNFQGVKRQTGGKTVLHHLELTYSFAANNDQFPKSILETYRLISQPLAKAFEQFGLKTEMNQEKKGQNRSSICFNEVSSYELTAENKKLVGSAQYRKRHRFIQHGAILLDIDWSTWKKTWKLPKDSMLLENRITSFKNQLGYIPPIGEIVESIAKNFAHSFNTTYIHHTFSAEEQSEIDELRPKYCWDW